MHANAFINRKNGGLAFAFPVAISCKNLSTKGDLHDRQSHLVQPRLFFD